MAIPGATSSLGHIVADAEHLRSTASWAGPASVTLHDGESENDVLLLAGVAYKRWYGPSDLTWHWSWLGLLLLGQLLGFAGVFQFVSVRGGAVPAHQR